MSRAQTISKALDIASKLSWMLITEDPEFNETPLRQELEDTIANLPTCVATEIRNEIARKAALVLKPYTATRATAKRHTAGRSNRRVVSLGLSSPGEFSRTRERSYHFTKGFRSYAVVG